MQKERSEERRVGKECRSRCNPPGCSQANKASHKPSLLPSKPPISLRCFSWVIQEDCTEIWLAVRAKDLYYSNIFPPCMIIQTMGFSAFP